MVRHMKKIVKKKHLHQNKIFNYQIILVRYGEKSKKYAQRLGIPEGYKPLHAVALGKKKNNNAKAPARKENTVSYVK